jgi:hypothetical protein
LSAREAEPGIVLIATAYRSDDVFPPQIRVLNGIAEHRVGTSDVISPGMAAADSDETRPANTA